MRVAAALAVLLAFISCGERLPPLTRAILEANHQTWLAHKLHNYDLDLVVTGTGLEEAETVHVEVRADSVARAERGGTPMTGNVSSYTVDGLFETLERECELATDKPEALGAPAGYRAYLQARFDPNLGYPLHYRRMVGGSNHKVEIRVLKLEK